MCVQQGLEDEHLGLVSPSAHPHPPLRKVQKPPPSVQYTAVSKGLDLDQRSAPKSGANPNLLSPMSPVQQSLAMQTMLSDLASPTPTNPRNQGWLAKKVQIFLHCSARNIILSSCHQVTFRSKKSPKDPILIWQNCICLAIST